MKKLLLLLSLLALPAFSQQTRVVPDCVISFTFTGANQETASNTCGQNTLGIVDWTLTYSANGFSALSLVVQSAPDAGGGPGTWATFAGSVTAGSNPNTSTTSAFTTFSGFFPFNRVRLATVTGTGTVTGRLYGFLAGGSGGGGGGGGCSSPCTVVQGSPAALNDTSVVTVFNGAAQAKAISCPNQAVLTVTTSGAKQLVALTGGTSIYLCHLDFSASAGSNFTLVYGTGSNCGTGTTNLTGTYQNVLTYSSPWDSLGPLVIPAGNALCINFASNVTAGGMLTYAQY